jgi:hypothetical protein
MSRMSALVLAIGVAAAVWIVLPIARPEVSAAIWFTGQDGFTGITLYGREVSAIIAGLGVWILALHFPDRPKPIIFRHSAEAAA